MKLSKCGLILQKLLTIKMRYQPAIVVVAYNRPNSLRRLLQSLNNLNISDKNIELVISIDKSEISEVSDIAENFNWKFGHKTVIKREQNLGLRNHIIECGKLTAQYGSIILLEDDLFVSPQMYQFAEDSINYYRGDDNISGVSLYSYDFHEYTQNSFQPFIDKYDVYFIQSASSWGQVWSKKHWDGFYSWYISKNEAYVSNHKQIPRNVKEWPQDSWKKYYITYLVESNTYFVFPRFSLSTNFSDQGVNQIGLNNNYQVPLLISEKETKFVEFYESQCKYDAFFEIIPEALKRIVSSLKDYEFEVDLYGIKELTNINNEYLLSIKPCGNPIYGYNFDMIPHEQNLIFTNKGSHISFGRLSDFEEMNIKSYYEQSIKINKDIGWKRSGVIFWKGFIQSIKRKYKSMTGFN